MSDYKLYEKVHRKLTRSEVAVRERVWVASRRGVGVTLTADEVADLWRSIFQTGRELDVLRDEHDRREACRD